MYFHYVKILINDLAVSRIFSLRRTQLKPRVYDGKCSIMVKFQWLITTQPLKVNFA